MDARAQGVSRVVVHLENTSVLDDSELLELVVLETKELLKSYNYTNNNSEIIHCPLKCGELPVPPEPEGDGNTVDLTVNAPDGPMPQFRTAIMNARAQGVSRVVVHLENTSVLNDGELLELVVLETKELLKSFNYTSRNSEIVQCARSC
jgi:translation elongation factor EF-Tu-like GTPase